MSSSLAIMRVNVVRILAFRVIASAAMSAAADRCPTAPSSWTVTTKEGPDFDVCYYRAESGTGVFGIYLGFHPMFHPPSGEKGVAGSVGDRPVEWFPKKPSPGAPLFAEQALVFQTPGDPKSGPVAHIWIYGTSAQEIESVRETVTKLRW